MARFWNSRFVLAGLVLALLLALTESERVTAGDSKRHSEPVTVVNTAANPVPIKAVGTTSVTGNVTIGADSKVQAQQSGLWNVGITNNSLPVTGSVSVLNLPLDSGGNVRTSGAHAPSFNYTRVFSSGAIVATQVSTLPGTVHTVVIGPGSSANYQILDKTNGCQGVPSSDSSIIFEGATNVAVGQTTILDANFANGLCVVLVPLGAPPPGTITVTWK